MFWLSLISVAIQVIQLGIQIGQFIFGVNSYLYYMQIFDVCQYLNKNQHIVPNLHIRNN